MRLLFIIAKTLEQLKYPSCSNWIGQMWCIHAKEYYLAIKKEKSIEIHPTWVDLENMMQTQKNQT